MKKKNINLEIKNLLINKLKLNKCIINNKSQHFEIIVVGKIFMNMSLLKKQKTVYSIIKHYILKKKIHAITINAFSIKEWKKIKFKKNIII